MSISRQHLRIAAAVFLGLASVAAAAWLWSPAPEASAQSEPDRSSSFLYQDVAPGDIRYVAVGDSYTIGTGATPQQSWPALMTRHLRRNGVKIGLAANLGIAGWTTQQALIAEAPVFRKQAPDFATLMIGVNDTYRATTVEEFRALLLSLIDQMQSVLPDKSKILLITIPDFTVTPSGAMYSGQSGGTSRILAFNAVIKQEAGKRGLLVVDVFALSQKMGKSKELIASDGLHPSAKEYALWEKQIYPTVETMLREKSR